MSTKRLFISVMAMLTVSSFALAQESTIATHILPESNSVNFIGGMQFSSGSMDMQDKEIQTNTKKIKVGVEYAPIDQLSIHLVVPALSQNSSTLLKTNKKVVSENSHTTLGRTEVGIDGKMINWIAGELMGHVNAELPTMMGYEADQGYEYFNHMAISASLSNIFDLPVYPGFITTSLGYTYKFPKSYNRITMDFGDDITGRFGAGYDFTSLVSSSLELEYTKTGPIKYSMGTLAKESAESMTTMRVIPSVTVDISDTLSVFANGGLLISQTQVTEKDFQFIQLSPIFTGSPEGYNKTSIHMGVKVGLF